MFDSELESALLTGDLNSAPLSVICQSLLASDALYSTRCQEILPELYYLDGLTEAIRFVDGCDLGNPACTLLIGSVTQCSTTGIGRKRSRFLLCDPRLTAKKNEPSLM